MRFYSKGHSLDRIETYFLKASVFAFGSITTLGRLRWGGSNANVQKLRWGGKVDR